MDEPVAEPIKKPKSTIKKFFIWIFVLLIISVIGTAVVFGVNKIYKQTTISENGPAGPAKNYQYPAVTAATKNRKIDCNKDIRMYRLNPKKVLCLNLYQTSPAQIKTKMAATNYDNVVLYGQNTIFDVATNINKPSDFASSAYNFARFNDLIGLPKLMQLYGVPNLKHINKDFSPYPAIYYEIRNQKEVNKNCRSGEYNVGGCSQFHFLIVLLDKVLSGEEQKSESVSWVRYETDDQLFYRRTIPADCYTSYIFMHETAHNLLYAREHKIVGMSMTGNYNDTPRWFSEEQAGLTGVIGMDAVCGNSIISDVHGSFAKKVTDANFIKFQSIYPSNPTGGGSPSNDCQKAIITSVYRFISTGKLEERMPKIMSAIRENSKIKGFFDSDKNFAKLILKMFNNDPTQRKFLNSKGCGI